MWSNPSGGHWSRPNGVYPSPYSPTENGGPAWPECTDLRHTMPGFSPEMYPEMKSASADNSSNYSNTYSSTSPNTQMMVSSHNSKNQSECLIIIFH
ncbi:hypothetical protein EB796_018746 [Bugula neritina]|uniref:Uncharacterized protein n=1 Tax=Bugula neritina TaxID=10212 RepID=A0A7J7JBC1_BUGNE|nr:hypothetical protein EB796_018746 [Bugula neritina]